VWALRLVVCDQVCDQVSRQLYFCSERIAINEIGDLFGVGWLRKKVAVHENGLVGYDCMCRRVRSLQRLLGTAAAFLHSPLFRSCIREDLQWLTWIES